MSQPAQARVSDGQALEHASVRQYCKAVKVPVIAANFVRLAEQAVKEKHSHIGYLEALLAMESEERDRHAIANRLHDAKLPRMKTLEEFEFARAPQIPAAKIRELAEGGYITRAEPVVLSPVITLTGKPAATLRISLICQPETSRLPWSGRVYTLLQ